MGYFITEQRNHSILYSQTGYFPAKYGYRVPESSHALSEMSDYFLHVFIYQSVILLKQVIIPDFIERIDVLQNSDRIRAMR